MTTWNPRANELFLKALAIRVRDERRKYLDRACGGDAPLRTEVEALLEANQRAGDSLKSPAEGIGVPVATRRPERHESDSSLREAGTHRPDANHQGR